MLLSEIRSAIREPTRSRWLQPRQIGSRQAASVSSPRAQNTNGWILHRIPSWAALRPGRIRGGSPRRRRTGAGAHQQARHPGPWPAFMTGLAHEAQHARPLGMLHSARSWSGFGPARRPRSERSWSRASRCAFDDVIISRTAGSLTVLHLGESGPAGGNPAVEASSGVFHERSWQGYLRQVTMFVWSLSRSSSTVPTGVVSRMRQCSTRSDSLSGISCKTTR